jgi:hypothetical protein
MGERYEVVEKSHLEKFKLASRVFDTFPETAG